MRVGKHWMLGAKNLLFGQRELPLSFLLHSHRRRRARLTHVVVLKILYEKDRKKPKIYHIKFNNKEYMGPPQFHTPLSSTHQLHIEGPLHFSPQNPSVPHQNPSVQHNPVSSTPKTPQFNTPPSVLHQKQLSSTSKTPQFHTKSSI